MTDRPATMNAAQIALKDDLMATIELHLMEGKLTQSETIGPVDFVQMLIEAHCHDAIESDVMDEMGSYGDSDDEPDRGEEWKQGGAK